MRIIGTRDGLSWNAGIDTSYIVLEVSRLTAVRNVKFKTFKLTEVYNILNNR